MPELPEVECVLRGLAKGINGERIASVEVLRKESIAHPTVTKFRRELPGKTFDGFARRGKYLLLTFKDGSGLACHLRMSGALVIKRKQFDRDKHLRVLLKMDSGKELHFEDMRVFGRLWYVEPGLTFEDVIPHLKVLGPEPLNGLNVQHLKESFASRKQAIKSALMDQSLLAGIGNIYADEILFLARIHPQTKACDVNAEQLKRIIKIIKQVLTQAIKAGGSSIRDYKDSQGENGNYQNEAFVYGRTGQRCVNCKQKIERVKLAGRYAHFCPSCQR